MVAIVNAINVVLTPIFDVICWPFRALAPIWALTVISLISGIFLVWLFGKTSDQDRIREIHKRTVYLRVPLLRPLLDKLMLLLSISVFLTNV